MTEREGRAYKVLFIVSRDFGELSNAQDFITRIGFAVRMLLPEPLHGLNRGRLDVPSEPYANLGDILSAVDLERPEMVLLFSGYLFAMNGLMKLDEVARLVAGLRERGIPLVTSDPFLGLLGPPAEGSISNLHPSKKELIGHFTRLHAILCDVPYVDVGPMSRGRLAYVNPHVMETDEQLVNREAAASGVAGLDPSRRRWPFVLSAEDYAHQAQHFGAEGFDRLLREKLQSALVAGRQSFVVAPKALRDASATFGPAPAGSVFLEYCDHSLVTSLLMTSEYAFYWNLSSNSIARRLLSGRPIFCLDAGHMARAMPGLASAGLERYYRGLSPSVFDAGSDWAERPLAELAGAQEWGLGPVRDDWLRSPTPRELVASVLGI